MRWRGQDAGWSWSVRQSSAVTTSGVQMSSGFLQYTLLCTSGLSYPYNRRVLEVDKENDVVIIHVADRESATRSASRCNLLSPVAG